MTEWIFGVAPLTYFTALWPLALTIGIVFFLPAPFQQRTAFVLFGSLSCYGIYLLLLWAVFQTTLCGIPERVEGSANILAQTRAWYACHVERSALISAVVSIPGLLWLAQLLRRRTA